MQSLEPQAPHLGKVDTCTHLLFCMNFNAQQLCFCMWNFVHFKWQVMITTGPYEALPTFSYPAFSRVGRGLADRLFVVLLGCQNNLSGGLLVLLLGCILYNSFKDHWRLSKMREIISLLALCNLLIANGRVL